MVGTFDRVSANYLPRYVAEFRWGYNNRHNDDFFVAAISAFSGCNIDRPPPLKKARKKGNGPGRSQNQNRRDSGKEGTKRAKTPLSKGTPSKHLVAEPGNEEHRQRVHERYFWRRQLRLSKGLNLITFWAAVVAVFALAGLAWSVNETHDATVEANRAWVKSEAPIGQFIEKSGQEFIQTSIQIENIGKEPAQNVRNDGSSFWMPTIYDGPNVIDARKLPYPSNDLCSVVPAEQARLGSIWPGPATSYRGVSEGAVQIKPGFTSGTILYGYHGCVTYETFGQIHHTRYCEWITPNPAVPADKWQWSLCQGQGQQGAD